MYWSILTGVLILFIGSNLSGASKLSSKLGVSQTLFSTSIQNQSGNGINAKYTYGNVYLIPSLISNSALEYIQSKSYSTLQVNWKTPIGRDLIYSGALEATDRPHELIGTKFSRPDYPISTGRIQKSVIDYQSESLLIRAGRANFFEGSYRASVFLPPINGDGLSWVYNKEGWAFKHVIESLPAEKSGDVVFRRLLTYHHLAYRFGHTVIGAGEYFILTGTALGLELKRLNPFLPFMLNSHDSEADLYPGFSGDSDNSLIKLFLDWERNGSKLNIRFYLDEFQIDSGDRELYSDALLFNISGMKEFKLIPVLDVPGKLECTISISNPNFGEHPGPFTTTTSAGFPLFEYNPGMLSLAYVKIVLQPNSVSQISLSAHHERWLETSSLSPDLRYIRSALKTLPIKEDSRFMLAYDREIPKLQATLSFATWRASDSQNSGMLVSLSTQYPF